MLGMMQGKKGGEMYKVFGYEWQDICRMQQGLPPLEIPDPKRVKEICTQRDLDLLFKYGERGLKERGFHGIVDRLQRSGVL
jgi:hypothetical protein